MRRRSWMLVAVVALLPLSAACVPGGPLPTVAVSPVWGVAQYVSTPDSLGHSYEATFVTCVAAGAVVTATIEPTASGLGWYLLQVRDPVGLDEANSSVPWQFIQVVDPPPGTVQIVSEPIDVDSCIRIRAASVSMNDRPAVPFTYTITW